MEIDPIDSLIAEFKRQQAVPHTPSNLRDLRTFYSLCFAFVGVLGFLLIAVAELVFALEVRAASPKVYLVS